MDSFSIKSLYSLALVYLLLGVKAATIPILSGKDVIAARADSPKVFVLDFNVEQLATNASTASVSRKTSSHPVTIAKGDQGYAYYVDLWLGSNKQKVTVQLDTGSSDLWVYDKAIKSSSAGTGYYNPKQSSTYNFVESGFGIEYADETWATGNWVKDSVTIGGKNSITVPQFTFADATNTTVTGGSVFGIGYDANESSNFTYHDFPHALKDNGIIDKIAYSLYLNSPEALSGTIIFGGIDQAKYTGELVTVKDDPRDPEALLLPVNSISFGGKTYSINLPAILDSGTSFTYLPNGVVNPYRKKYFANSTYDDEGGVYYVDGHCPSAADIDFNFNGTSITVPQSDILVYISGEKRCELHLVGEDIDPEYPNAAWILGDTFLRHAYVYYDLEDNTIALAQVKYTSDSHIISV